MIYSTSDGKHFQTHNEMREYLLAVQKKLINKMILNSNYGFTPGSLSRRLRKAKHRTRDKAAASIWRRIFGDPKPKPKRYRPLPGGSSLQFNSSATVRLFNARKAEDITKTGRLSLAKLLEKFPDVQK